MNADQKVKYLFGAIAAAMTGSVYPAFGIVFGEFLLRLLVLFTGANIFITAKGIEGFSAIDNGTRRHAGDRNALWFFIIAIISTGCIAAQNYLFAAAAAQLTYKIRSKSFKAMLRQDIEYFDKDEHSVCFVSFAFSRLLTVFSFFLDWCFDIELK
jgi:ATP-binding cassette subfamily B (MDR/TAP) protein 1